MLIENTDPSGPCTCLRTGIIPFLEFGRNAHFSFNMAWAWMALRPAL